MMDPGMKSRTNEKAVKQKTRERVLQFKVRHMIINIVEGIKTLDFEMQFI